MNKEERKSSLREQTVCVIAGVTKEQPQSPLKAIREFCKDCYGGAESGECSINQCVSKNRCPLWPFRFGKNPFHTKGDTMTDDQRQAASDRLKIARDKKSQTDEEDDE